MQNLTKFKAMTDVGFGVLFGILGGGAATIFNIDRLTILIATVVIILGILLTQRVKSAVAKTGMDTLANLSGDPDVKENIDRLHQDEARAFPRFAFAGGIAAGVLIGVLFPDQIFSLLSIGN